MCNTRAILALASILLAGGCASDRPPQVFSSQFRIAASGDQDQRLGEVKAFLEKSGYTVSSNGWPLTATKTETGPSLSGSSERIDTTRRVRARRVALDANFEGYEVELTGWHTPRLPAKHPWSGLEPLCRELSDTQQEIARFLANGVENAQIPPSPSPVP